MTEDSPRAVPPQVQVDPCKPHNLDPRENLPSVPGTRGWPARRRVCGCLECLPWDLKAYGHGWDPSVLIWKTEEKNLLPRLPGC